MIPHLVVIYTPKEAHSRIFVTGGSVFGVTNAGQKNISILGRPDYRARYINISLCLVSITLDMAQVCASCDTRDPDDPSSREVIRRFKCIPQLAASAALIII